MAIGGRLISNLPRGVAAAVAVLALGTVILASCGSSDNDRPEGPEAIPEVEPTDVPTLEQVPTLVGTPDPTPVPTPDPTPGIGVVATGVGYFEPTYVDSSRTTPPNRGDAGRDSRMLRSLVMYPAAVEGEADRPIENAEPAGGPYPLVLFAHGLGGHPEGYAEFLAAVASVGYVVVAPEFPRSSKFNPGGPDAGDTASQPGDLSFLIDMVVALAADSEWPLAGLVDTTRIAAMGHSNGAVTVHGISANSCCRDDRIDAVVAIAGPPAPSSGEYDFTATPPVLLVHGTEDAAILYETSVVLFNQISAVKGLLTLAGGDHGAGLNPSSEFFDDVTATVADFLAVALDGDDGAAVRLGQPRSTPRAELVFAAEPDSGVSIEIETVETNRMASAEPSTGLVGGQTVVVSWSGYLPGQTVNVLQCSQGGLEGSEVCDFTHAKILHPNPTGEGSVEMVIIAGPVGTGVCDATVDDCVIAVNDSGILEPEATIRVPLSFAP